MMGIARYFRAQAHNNAWANHRLLTACGSLSDRDLAAPRTSFFPSIIGTLNHILTVDWFYVSALEGEPMSWEDAFAEAVPFPALAELRREQLKVDERLISFCLDLDEQRLGAFAELDRRTWLQVEPADRVLLHLFQHQVHHRGQVHAMLAGTEVPPPQLDEFFLAHEREQALRRDDFIALGFDEDHVWR